MIQTFMPQEFVIKEAFYTLQGEGMNVGRPAVFCRFAGCNLWSGREEDRATAKCRFCDTEFVGGTRIKSPGQLAVALRQKWPTRVGAKPFVVLTGGEPTLQVTPSLLTELHALGFEVAIETNGTRQVPRMVDWVTVSPKAGVDVVQKSGDEVKVIWPQNIDLEEILTWNFSHFLLQPMDGHEGAVAETVEHCLKDQRWRLSLQTHKWIGLR